MSDSTDNNVSPETKKIVDEHLKQFSPAWKELADAPKREGIRPLRMDAYYYSFEPTGVREVDEILSAVAWAGKACHHTSSWCDDWTSYLPDCEKTPIDFIQRRANEASAEISRLRAALEKIDTPIPILDAKELMAWAIKAKVTAREALRVGTGSGEGE